MAAPTVSEFLALFPAFIEEPASRIQSALDFSALLLDSGTWGDFYHRAVALTLPILWLCLFRRKRASPPPLGAPPGPCPLSLGPGSLSVSMPLPLFGVRAIMPIGIPRLFTVSSFFGFKIWYWAGRG